MPLQSILFEINIALKKVGIHIDANEKSIKEEALGIQGLLEKSESVIAHLDVSRWNLPIRDSLRSAHFIRHEDGFHSSKEQQRS